RREKGTACSVAGSKQIKFKNLDQKMTAPSQKQDGAGCKKRKICQNRNALGPAADKKKGEGKTWQE
ncbi:MAG: hypothetical protein WBO85_07305, partial [Fusicatenibacter saccharivorans]